MNYILIAVMVMCAAVIVWGLKQMVGMAKELRDLERNPFNK